jgi:hypothetical protein
VTNRGTSQRQTFAPTSAPGKSPRSREREGRTIRLHRRERWGYSRRCSKIQVRCTRLSRLSSVIIRGWGEEARDGPGRTPGLFVVLLPTSGGSLHPPGSAVPRGVACVCTGKRRQQTPAASVCERLRCESAWIRSVRVPTHRTYLFCGCDDVAAVSAGIINHAGEVARCYTPTSTPDTMVADAIPRPGYPSLSLSLTL